MIGRELDGRYRILSKLGEGAMGEVYLVEHVQLQRREALKVLRPSLDASGDIVSRFRREARATNRLSHPNIVSVYDFGRLPDGRFYLTTELADGEDLDRLLARVGALPTGRALAILVQLADALAHAHERGVIHRDLKPANMVLEDRRDGERLKVLDFGVAKIIAPDYQESLVVSRQGELYGTPAYLAPEQIQGAVDPRIDIYAIGCIAHELLSGAPPFGGKTIEIIGGHLRKQPPRLREQLPDVAPELEAVIYRCLEKNPNRRFASAAELRDALRGLADYPEERTGRRSAPRIGGPAGGGAAVAETLHGAPELGGGGGPLVDEARADYQAALRRLAEAAIDRGAGDIQLTVATANAADAHGELARLDGQVDALIAREAAAEQRRREHEGSLRFAIGELRFECEQARAAGRPVDPDIEHQLAELESSLASLAGQIERELDSITERGIELAAERATVEDRLDRLCAAIEARLDPIVPTLAGDPTIAALERELRSARVSLEVSRRLR